MPQQASAASKKAKVVGVVKAISGSSITLQTDTGSEVTFTIASRDQAGAHGARANRSEDRSCNPVE